jgi:hypothetical protein
MKCATLPYKARHEYDDHPLLLTYMNANDYQPSCIICEEDRDPKLWFYRCEECDFDAHPECALGKYPYVASILNTLTLLLWSSRQRIIQHAILVATVNPHGLPIWREHHLIRPWPIHLLQVTTKL